MKDKTEGLPVSEIGKGDDGHYYFVHPDGSIETMHDLTLAQARKRGCYASVTTKIGVLSNPFIDRWKKKELIKQASLNPRLDNEELDEYVTRIDNITWGQPVRWDGQKFQSNEFGLAVHAELENWNRNASYKIAPEWEMYCVGFQSWARANLSEMVAAEYMAVDHDLRTVGTVDLIARKSDGTVCLADFKCRECGSKGVGKFYDKDCMQLAIEASIVRREMNLEYIPECWSMCICANTGTLYPKKWTDKAVAKADRKFRALSYAYDIINGFDGEDNGH